MNSVPKWAPKKCDICGRRWNKVATAVMQQFYPDALVCEHPGKCKGHPEGERCQYLYGALSIPLGSTKSGYYKCGLRLA